MSDESKKEINSIIGIFLIFYSILFIFLGLLK